MTNSQPAGGRAPNANRMYRNTTDGMFFGVCAGFADYFGFDLTVTRVLTVLGGFIFFPTVLIAYIVLGLLLKPGPVPPKRQRGTEEDTELRRRVRAEPHSTLNSVRHRYKDLERRLQRLERVVTSQRYRLDREFEGLRDDER